MNIANLIKDLRNKTGAGFLDCKNALSENNNNIDHAIEYLRKKGLAKASKKTSRVANEGAIGLYSNENVVCIIKVNSETDFAAKSDTFLSFLDELGKIAIDKNDPNLSKEEFMKLEINNSSISDYFNNMIAKIGENLILNDLLVFKNEKSFFSYYIHNSYKENIGKIISFVQYETSDNNSEVKNISKNICMHIAAMKPESIDVNDLDKNLVDNEKKIQKELILNSGKPSNIVDKILDGKMKKFYSDITLLNQNYILDTEKTVGEFLSNFNKKFKYKINYFKILTL